MQTPVFNTNLKSLPLMHRGKVRDLYTIDSDKLLIVQTDRISAFDTVLPTPIPGKGHILTEMTKYWFNKLGYLTPHHYLNHDPKDAVSDVDFNNVEGRSLVVKKISPLPVEAVVRGYMAGSGWSEYQKSQSICLEKLPAGINLGEKLSKPIFTPSTKASLGSHDENIAFAKMREIVGSERATEIKQKSILLYTKAWEHCIEKGIIVADTKFEFGLDNQDQLVLIDEILTPDSSRFWSSGRVVLGCSPPSFDKQFVRDWLDRQGWDKTSSAPKLPQIIVEQTKEKYLEALNIVCNDS